MTKISVILTAFNEEKYIAKAVESILNQTLADWELIIVDDGSTDRTPDILNEFEDPRISIISQENSGPGAGRNRALKMACGEYIMYLDGDDWYRSDALEIAYGEAKKRNTDFTFYQMINYDDTTHELYENDWFNLNIFDESFENCVFAPSDFKKSIFDLSVGVCQKIYSADFLRRIDARFPEGIFFEDMPFFYYVFLKAERISIIKEKLYFRRKHDKSITHVVDEKFLDTVPAGCELIERFIDNGWYETYKYDLLAYKINGPRFALRDIKEEFRVPMYNLIKDDYEKIRMTSLYRDYLENLGPVKKKFFLDILKSEDYYDFRTLNQE